jgi:hypothetical protein
MSSGYSASGFKKGVKYHAPRSTASAAADRVAARRALMLEIARRSNYGGPSQGFSGAPRAGRARLIEHKTFDWNPTGATVALAMGNDVAVATTPFAPNNAASLGCINQVPLGNSSITRVGRRLNITAVALRGQIYAGSTSPAVKGTVLLIWDRHPNKAAALPAWNTILNAQTPDALTNKDYAPRFKILRRWDFAAVGSGSSGANQTSAGQFVIDEFVKLKNKVTIWDAADTTGVVTNMLEGGLYLAQVCDEAQSTSALTLVCNTRVYFQDS